MKKAVYMFPGQGSQKAGMRSGLGSMSDGQSRLFKIADEVLGFGLTDIIDSGPDEVLTRTSNAQPALLSMGMAFAMGADDRGCRPNIVMGHSLGEYTALCFSSSISFEDALALVRKRGELMEAASEKAPGRMAAVIGADMERLGKLILDCSSKGVIEITNYNSRQQVVLSGEISSIEEAVNRINSDRIGKAMMLNVSAPFHSSLMKPVAEEFREYLARIKINPPEVCFIDNVTGMEEKDPEKIKEKLVLQLYSPVLWEKAVNTANDMGAVKFIECGPGSVLSGLVKRIVKGADIITGESLLCA